MVDANANGNGHVTVTPAAPRSQVIPVGVPETTIVHPKKLAFLRAYAECGMITVAAKKAHTSRFTHQSWYTQKGPEGDEYRRVFGQLRELLGIVIEDELYRRAIVGTKTPIYQGGKLVGCVRKYSDLLLIVLARANMPEKYVDAKKVPKDLAELYADPRKDEGQDAA